jgi:hypothetical protein
MCYKYIQDQKQMSSDKHEIKSSSEDATRHKIKALQVWAAVVRKDLDVGLLYTPTKT